MWPPGFVGMPFGSFVSAISRNGNGYSITNSLIFNGRGRGFIVRGSQALIQGNRIIHMTDTSLHMAPGVDYSREAGFIENVLVRTESKNHIKPSNWHPWAHEMISRTHDHELNSLF